MFSQQTAETFKWIIPVWETELITTIEQKTIYSYEQKKNEKKKLYAVCAK